MFLPYNVHNVRWLAPLVVALATPAVSWADGSGFTPKRPHKPRAELTADHSKFAALKKEFTSGPQVTKACLSCHTEAGKQLSNKIHWTWICPKSKSQKVGKAGIVLNNF